MGKKCCVPFCERDTPRTEKRAVHRFPPVSEGTNRYELWIARIGRIDLLMLDQTYVCYRYFVCSAHFSEKQRMQVFCRNRTPLMRTAVPELYLPYQPYEFFPSAAERDHNYKTLPQHKVKALTFCEHNAKEPEHGLEEDFLNIKSTHICLFCMKTLNRNEENNIQTQVTKEGKLVEDYLRTTLLSVGVEKLIESYFVCSNCLESINQFEEYLSKCNAIQAVLQAQYDEHRKLKQDKKQSKEEEFLILNTGDDGIPTFDFPVLCDTKEYSTVCTQTGEEDDEDTQGDILRELLMDSNTYQEGTIDDAGEKFYSDGVEITNPAWINRIRKQRGLTQNVTQQPRVKKKVVHSGSGYCCEKCGKVFWRYKTFKQHEETHIYEGKLICEICSKTFSTRLGLKNHALRHSGNKPHACEVCEKRFFSRQAMRMHSMSVHPVATDNNGFCCDQCGKFYYSVYAFKQHTQTHKNVHKLRCEICDKTFTQPQALRRHYWIHEEIRPYKCEICEKSFRTKTHMKSHLNAHNGIRNFICDTCGRAFVTRANLSNHKKVHMAIKPYICPVCGNGFSHRVTMKAHMRVLHKDVNV